MVVLTGGPGAGKTAVLEVVRRNFCEHVVVLPEAASILFSGGFPRGTSSHALNATQRAIFHVQRELERLVCDERRAAVVLCDRGTVDGLAYSDDGEALLAQLGSSRAAELARYHAVVHLRTPSADSGYDHSNRVRTETAEQALALDAAIAAAWQGHPRRCFVDSTSDFMAKLAGAIDAIRREVPPCCRSHAVPEAGLAGEPGAPSC